MSLRRRRPDQPVLTADALAVSPDARSLRPATARPTSPSSAAGVHSRFRWLLLVAPVLFAAYIVVGKWPSHNLDEPRPLPVHYAVCTPSKNDRAAAILTMDESKGDQTMRTQCIVVNEGIVVGEGTRDQVRQEWGDLDTVGRGVGRLGGVKIYYLQPGQTLMPGLVDAHAHVLQQGESASAVNLVGATSVKEVVDRIAAFVDADPELRDDKSRFILGLGWDQTKYKETNGAFPTAVCSLANVRGSRPYPEFPDSPRRQISRAILDFKVDRFT